VIRQPSRDPLHLSGTQLLDRYLVEGPIAQGGMAVIYRGRDLRLLRPVCIKVFHRLQGGELGYRTAFEHFVQEAFALSQFLHPNTLRIYDFGYLAGDLETTGAPFQISELLDGGTLWQRVKREGPLTLDAVLEILTPIAGALAEAHARGIVHRDIKPSNILFGNAGGRKIVKLCDFGIAKVHDPDGSPNRAEDTVTSCGQRMRLFSPGWAAPEQMRGEPVGPAADVYALGLVTAFMLLGRAIFEIGRDDDIELARLDSEASIARALDDACLSQGVVDALVHATRDDVDQRLATVEELVTAIAAEVARDTVRTPPRLVIPLSAEPDVDRPSPPSFFPVGTLPVAPAAAETTPFARPTPDDRAPLAVDPDGDGEVLVAGRRLRLVPMAGADQLDLGGDGPWLRSPARFRITITPSTGAIPRINLKGLNCFVARAGARPSTAVDVEADADVDLLAPDRRSLDGVRCTLGRPGEAGRLFDLGGVTLAVPEAAGAILLDLGPGRELALLHRGAARGKKRKP
jgi:serine/threonine-protein kinase